MESMQNLSEFSWNRSGSFYSLHKAHVSALIMWQLVFSVVEDDDLGQTKGQIPDKRGGNSYFSVPGHTPVIFR